MVQQIFAQATAAHAAGDRARAEALYRQVLALSPQHPDALHLLGRLTCEAGQPQAALGLIEAAVRLRPRIAEYQAGLGEVQRALGQTREAAETFRRAVRLKPESAPIQMGHGLALAAAGQGALAIQALRRAVARDPALMPAHGALGSVLLAEGQAQAAAEAFRTAYRLAPNDGLTAFNLGCALQALGELPGAEQAFRTALAQMPGHVPAQGNLARVLQTAGRLEEAASILEAALAAAPNEAGLWLNLGLVRRELSRFAEAEAAFRRLEALAPSADSLACLGNTLRDQGRLAESEDVLVQAVARDGENPEARTALAVTRMLGGDLLRGWPDFAWRQAAESVRAHVRQSISAPVWRGEALDGPLLIYAEQGAGDFIQMCRFVARAAERVPRIVLRVPENLRRLAQGVAGAAAVVTPEEAPPHCAAICADIDLPAVLGIGLADVAAPDPYLHADAAETDAWRARLAALPGRRVGLAWFGNPEYFHDRQRSIAPDALLALAGTPGISFVSLQPGGAAPAALHLTDWTAELTDFAATAGLVSALDLVISVDSAVAHLAGALATPVWLLNRYAPDWRWLLGRDDSPWYPSLRQFRQSSPDDWGDVLSRVRKEVVLF
jgi:tetratricopeptide (TPR) repeat protein